MRQNLKKAYAIYVDNTDWPIILNSNSEITFSSSRIIVLSIPKTSASYGTSMELPLSFIIVFENLYNTLKRGCTSSFGFTELKRACTLCSSPCTFAFFVFCKFIFTHNKHIQYAKKYVHLNLHIIVMIAFLNSRAKDNHVSRSC